MKEHGFLMQTELFRGVQLQEMPELLSCLKARKKRFRRDQVILRAGDCPREFGLVLSGSVDLSVNYYWGGSSLLGRIGKGDIFAETCAALPGQEMRWDAVAAEDTEILFLDMEAVMTPCESNCAFHNRLIRNVIRISAGKNLQLSARMMHTAPKTIRERLLSYLTEQASAAGSPHFTIPFSRQQLADYLEVDRSALSNELSKMRRDGLITCRKNDFTLLHAQEN
ncbi:MAG: Crp/Fnr family transcriptional regulator [Clostridia bacterium]|nr:Crp/Fnr family transcriptional regulator [Clostridia bacterium]